MCRLFLFLVAHTHNRKQVDLQESKQKVLPLTHHLVALGGVLSPTWPGTRLHQSGQWWREGETYALVFSLLRCVALSCHLLPRVVEEAATAVECIGFG